MIPFLCVQLDPRDLFKTEARHTVAAREHFTATCFEAAPSLFSFLQKQLKCYFVFFSPCCLELLGSHSLCAVWNLPASRL